MTRRSLATLAVLTLIATLLVAPAAADAASHRGTAAHAKQIVAIAKKYVGKARYRSGGASPKHGFDCSGFTRYVYKRAGAGTLPHSANGQRRAKRMKIINHRRDARPGDLVFYQDGGYTFHVAVYAGHGKQYAATTPGTRIKKQQIWSSHVKYGRLR